MAIDAPVEIPLISLITSTSKEVLHALSTVGFIHLELPGTGLTQDDIDRAFKFSERIDSVPDVERQRYMIDDQGNGYLGINGSLDERTNKADLKESYIWGRYKGDESGTTQKLPPSVQKYKQDIVEFDKKCFEASLRVLDMISEAFILPRDFFRLTHKNSGSNGMSFLHYPALVEPPAGDDIRAGSHKDWGDVTLLFQQQGGQPGLQVYLPTEAAKKSTGIQLLQGDVDLESGMWISAPIVPNTVLVNVGLTLEGMTDGLCKANIHRVIFPPSAAGDLPKARKSIAYFSTPSHDVIMNLVQPGGLISEKEGASTVGEFFIERQRLAQVV